MSPAPTPATAPEIRIACLGRGGAELLLGRRGPYPVDTFDSVPELLAAARRLQPRICLVDVGPAVSAPPSAQEAVKSIRRELPLTDIVLWAPGAPAALVRGALLAGAKDVLLDDDAEALARRIQAVVEEQTLLPRMLEQERSGGTWAFDELISRSRKMWDVFETCIRTAATDAPALILGETGTGKELIARALHRRSGRSGRFVPVNCGAVPDTLIDSELFGHVEGAFTGARKAKEGLFRHAEGGTLFLDEIGNIPLEAQNRLLRTLQESSVRPVGGHEEVPIDVRVLAATSVPLEEEIEAGRFREDLLYRIDVLRLILPPLRERPEDLILLLGRFLSRLAEDYSLRRPVVGEDFLDCVCAYDWPGNVRELENFVERLVLTHPGERLGRREFDGLMRTYHGRKGAPADLPGPGPVQPDVSRPLPDVLAEIELETERRYLEAMLRETGGRVGESAEKAGVHRRTMLRKLKAHGIDKRDYRH